MAVSNTKRRAGRALPPLETRFVFLGDAVAPGEKKALRSAQFEVLDQTTGFERNLKLWRKTGNSVDADLRQLWLHEMRQVQRVMSYAGARDVIVDILEFVEDSENFGVLLEHAGQPLSAKQLRVSRQHWLKNLGAPRPRTLFWRNIRRLVTALGIVHAQGLVHGTISAGCVMTEGSEDPDFQLTGFEWSLWLSADKSEKAQAKLGEVAAAIRTDRYSFAEDWRALGKLAAHSLDAVVRLSGDVQSAGRSETPINLSTSERVFLKRLVNPTRTDSLEALSIARAVDDIIADVGRSVASRSGTFILMFAQNSGLGEAVFTVTEGAIPIDEYRAQLDWVRADLDGGATLMMPRNFDPAQDKANLVTSTMNYSIGPIRQDGSAAWDVAVCGRAEPRPEALRIGDQDEHELVQPIEVVSSVRLAVDTRARLGPDALDWSVFASPRGGTGAPTRTDLIRRSLLLVQVIEAVVKSLEVYPVELLGTEHRDGRRYVVVRAQPQNERDPIAKRIGLTEASAALKRLFEDDHRDADAQWRFSQAASLGASRRNDVTATFADIQEHRGRLAYRFEVDEDLPSSGPLFLRPERDAGTEGVIARRLRNIKALTTRVDLSEMLDDPWRVRRSSREDLSEDDKADKYFEDLDVPKQEALVGLWSTLPSYFVVGPPGVGKTRLATETVRRRFSDDRSARLLLTAQGHDALDHLQEKVKEMLEENKLDDLIIVRSTASERRPTSDEDVHRAGLEYLKILSESPLTRDAPGPLRDRVHSLTASAGRLSKSKDAFEKDDRVALNAVSSLVLDAANIVISTANSPDIERLVEAREQFDWVIVEEAAKATGPELIGPLMLSGRRLLIGDHHQLPPFEADRLVKVLRDHSLVAEALKLSDQYVGPLMRDGEIGELEQVARDPVSLREIADMALRLFEPFRTFVVEDERRLLGNSNHRPISSTLTEQRRMDPAIARIVSAAFYENKLHTQPDRAKAAEEKEPPFEVIEPLPQSPVVMVDFKHVSATGSGARAEKMRPRWHNPSEVHATFDVLRHIRARKTSEKPPTLVVLSFYKAQVEKLSERIDAGIRSGLLGHLSNFAPVLGGKKWVSTVDGFQGNEADLVILSLVRNNSGTGASALGFLRDRRRMNVALSRAKSKLVIVGSLAFLREAVRGVNPDAGKHDLAFLTDVADTIDQLARETRGQNVKLASVIDPNILRLGS
ncbi:DNA helicase [Mesorhizobium sp. NZP2234]|uniref:DEAD/DEAH box helicase n=1 Tax=Mesorhizobium sp. NZP2234 TaxID=2483402 RepID=UPI001553ABB9|nr:ATP-binding protein [Mesorhizobium sp. NZP2234]QKC90602.1 DNA helicase [Mesorhizobium sp. NZP2234]